MPESDFDDALGLDALIAFPLLDLNNLIYPPLREMATTDQSIPWRSTKQSSGLRLTAAQWLLETGQEGVDPHSTRPGQKTHTREHKRAPVDRNRPDTRQMDKIERQTRQRQTDGEEKQRPRKALVLSVQTHGR